MSDDMIIQPIGECVRSLRLERNMTQEELGERAGVHSMTVRDLELGKRSTLLTLIQDLRSLDEWNNSRTIESEPFSILRRETRWAQMSPTSSQ